MAAAANRIPSDRRDSDREEVFYRTRATPTGMASLPVQIVNISANGFMARTEADLPVGHKLTVRLPVVGEIEADVRWSLGGRIGCQFARIIPFAPYLELLGELAKGGR